jgi:hypothetical protein
MGAANRRKRAKEPAVVDLSPGPSPAVRITVLLRMVSEGFEDAFGTEPAWVEAPAHEHDELRATVGPERFAKVTERIGLRSGAAYRAGGPEGTVDLAPAAVDGVLGLLGMAALPADVLVEESDEGPRYHVPDDWFLVSPAALEDQGR